MPEDMSRCAVLVSTLSSRAKSEDAVDVSAEDASKRGVSLVTDRPNVEASDALPPADAMPKPMPPTSNNEAHPTATAHAAMPVLFFV